MSFELWIIISVLAGVLIAIFGTILSDKFVFPNKRKEENERNLRLALTEGIVWLAPIIAHLRKCVIMTRDYRMGLISEQQIDEVWPKLNLKDLETESGRDVMPWLPADMVHQGLDIAAQFEYIMQLLPAAFHAAPKEGKTKSDCIFEHGERLQNLLNQFEALDNDLRHSFAESSNKPR